MSNLYIYAGVFTALAALLTFGIPLFLAEYFPWRSLKAQRVGPHPTPRTPSYAGRTALITGANGAFGSRAAKIFASRGIATLVLLDVRDCGGVKAEIEAELKKDGKKIPQILVWTIDMMTFEGCREVGRRAEKELQNLDHVLLTAGILAFNCRQSPEGWEHSIQVNFLSTALISLLLLPRLKSAPSNPNPPVLTFVTTFGIYPSSFTMGSPREGKSYLKSLSTTSDGMMQPHQYGRSKALLLYFSSYLATLVSSSGKAITINSGDPGSAWTPLTNPNQSQLIPRLIMNFGARSPDICATALVNAVSSGADAHGKIMQDWDTATYPPFMLRKSGRRAQRRVWEEARAEFVAKAPEVEAVYEMLGDN